MVGGVVWSACVIRRSLLAAANRRSISICDWLSLDIRMEKIVSSLSFCFSDSLRALFSVISSVGSGGGGLGAGAAFFVLILFVIASDAMFLLHAMLRLYDASERIDAFVFGGWHSLFLMLFDSV